MSFDPDKAKPAQSVIFSQKTKTIACPNLYINNLPFVKTISQKHLALNLHVTLASNDHGNEGIGKVMKGVELLRRLQYFLPSSSPLFTNPS